MNNCRLVGKDQRSRGNGRNPGDYQHWARSYGQLPPMSGQLRSNRFEVASRRQSTSRERRLTSRDKQLSAKLRNLAATIASTEFVIKKSISKHKQLKKGEEKMLSCRDSCSTADLGALAELDQPNNGRSKSTRRVRLVVHPPEEPYQKPRKQSLLKSYRDIQQEQLEMAIANKQRELAVIRQQEAATRRRLGEEIQHLDRNNNTLKQQNLELQASEQKLRQSIEKLQGELEDCRGKLSRKQDMVTSSTATEPIETPLCNCNNLSPSVEKNEYMLRKTVRLNQQYETVICDLHLANRLYKGELDKCGRSKSPEFIEAERKMLKQQASRKRLQ